MGAADKKELNMEEIDCNFAVTSDLGRDDIRFFDIKKNRNICSELALMPSDFIACPRNLRSLSVTVSFPSIAVHRVGAFDFGPILPLWRSPFSCHATR